MNRSYRKLPMQPNWCMSRYWSSYHNSKTYRLQRKWPFWFELVYLFCFVYRFLNRYEFGIRRYRTSDWWLYNRLCPYSFASTYKIRFASLPLSLFLYKYSNHCTNMNRSCRKLPMPPSWYKHRCWSNYHSSKTYRPQHKWPFWFGLASRFGFVYRFLNPFWFDSRRYRTSDWWLYKHLNPYSFASTYKICFALPPLSLFRYKYPNRSSSKTYR